MLNDINVLEWLAEKEISVSDKTAFIDEEKKITYGELGRNTRIIGEYLHNNKVGDGAVAIILDKSIVTIEIMLGIVYAGGYYSVIDPDFPEERVDSIIQSLNPIAIVVDGNKKTSNRWEKKLITLEEINNELERSVCGEWRWNDKHHSMRPLYCNFTSGSTGRPKGIIISHASVLDFIPCFCETLKLSCEDIFANQAPLDFDVSVKDIYSGLFLGATVVLIKKKQFLFPKELMDMLEKNQITVMVWAVSALVYLVKMKCFDYKCLNTLKKVYFSGEIMPMQIARKLYEFYPQVSFVNLYGPTECTCNCCYYVMQAEDFEKEEIPLGRTFRNKYVYLMSEKGDVVEENGSEGEICIEGIGLYIGGTNAEEDRCKKNQDGVRVYYTGDVGRYDEKGMLYFVGRKDFQIKHMGHRIELQEIERCAEEIKTTDCIRAVSMYNNDGKYIVLVYEGGMMEKELEQELRKKLPLFMIPRKIVKRDFLPIDSHGKINRKQVKADYERENTGHFA